MPYDVSLGDSVAINGICLTVESISANELSFTAVNETLSRTALGAARPGDKVNLERALLPTDRMGGHIVLGHVDGVGRILSDRGDGESIVRTIQVPASLIPFMAPKGSVAVNGVSLTIADAKENTISISLIPYTLRTTTMGMVRSGDVVNIECDVLARYIAQCIKSDHAGEASRKENLLSKMETLGF